MRAPVPLLLFLLAGCGSEPLAGGKNLLLVTLDTTRADFLSCLGSAGDTPRLDALAERSALFTRATSETNVTNPSHLTILSGLRAIDHGVIRNDVDPAPETELLAQVLARGGYRTAGFTAVQHLARVAGRGFDEFPAVDVELFADEVTDRALAWLRAGDERPFFLWVHYFDPHALYQPPPELAQRFYEGEREAGDGPTLASDPYFDLQSTPEDLRAWLGDACDPGWARAMYAAELFLVDRELGRLLDALDDAGARDETVVVVVGDHGESLGEHGIHYDHKGLYEESLAVPLLVSVPGLPARRVDIPVSTLDVAPTLTELLGVRLGHALPGASLVRALSGEPDPALTGRTFVHQHMKNQAVAVRRGDWKLIWPINTEHPLFAAGPELYDLGTDPSESRDLAASEPGRVEELRAWIAPWIELGQVRAGKRADLDEEALERLRALGY
jgi:arylsulfatase A-like enzyme